MKGQHVKLFTFLLVITFSALGSDAADQANTPGLGPETDTLYVGDLGHITDEGEVVGGSVKSFNAQTGKQKTSFIPEANSPIKGPHGLLVAGGELIIVNQNLDPTVTLHKPGDVQQFLLTSRKFVGFLVEKAAAPFVPYAAVLLNGVFYVGNFAANDVDPLQGGSIYVFAGNGEFIGNLAPPPSFKFHPRGIVFNPRDGLLYVSNCPNAVANAPPIPPSAGNGGQVLKFDPVTLKFKGIFINDEGGVRGLNRPDGLVFGPDGNLYVTSFRFSFDPIDPAAVDSIRVYNAFGRFIDHIPLYNRGQPRAFAQAILFGPRGRLFVPISGEQPSAGEIRMYDVRRKRYEIFVKTGILESPQYLTFGRTDPATLAYGLGNKASQR
jgi:DNA-binding beta-propeller fold protein YncE